MTPEQLKHFFRSPDYLRFIEYLQDERKEAYRKLSRENNTNNVFRLQGDIERLNKLIDIRTQMGTNYGD